MINVNVHWARKPKPMLAEALDPRAFGVQPRDGWCVIAHLNAGKIPHEISLCDRSSVWYTHVHVICPRNDSLVPHGTQESAVVHEPRNTCALKLTAKQCKHLESSPWTFWVSTDVCDM